MLLSFRHIFAFSCLYRFLLLYDGHVHSFFFFLESFACPCRWVLVNAQGSGGPAWGPAAFLHFPEMGFSFPPSTRPLGAHSCGRM